MWCNEVAYYIGGHVGFFKEMALGFVILMSVIQSCAWVDQEQQFQDELANDPRVEQVIELKERICFDERESLYGPEHMQDLAADGLDKALVEHEVLVDALERDWHVSYGAVPWWRKNARFALARVQGITGFSEAGDQWSCDPRAY